MEQCGLGGFVVSHDLCSQSWVLQRIVTYTALPCALTLTLTGSYPHVLSTGMLYWYSEPRICDNNRAVIRCWHFTQFLFWEVLTSTGVRHYYSKETTKMIFIAIYSYVNVTHWLHRVVWAIDGHLWEYCILHVHRYCSHIDNRVQIRCHIKRCLFISNPITALLCFYLFFYSTEWTVKHR